MPDFRSVVEGLPVVLVLAAISYRICGFYEVHRLQRLPRELRVICQASGLLFLLVIAAAFYRRDLYESRIALGLFLILHVSAITVTRRSIWLGLARLRQHGLNHGKAVIVGAGRTGRLLAKIIQTNRWSGLGGDRLRRRTEQVRAGGPPTFCAIHQLHDIVAKHGIDHVFVALPLTR